MTFAVHPGSVGCDGPEQRLHRGVNVGATAYEEVVMFLLDVPGVDPQPTAGSQRPAA